MRRRSAGSLLAALALVALPRPPAGADDSPADLVRALGGEDQTKRYPAFQALLAKHPPEALPLLAKLTPGFDLSAQSYGYSLVQGYPPEVSRPVLQRWLQGDAPYLVAAAGANLLRQGDPKAAPALAQAIARPDLEPGTLSMMLSQMYALKDPRIQAAVRALVRPSADPIVLSAALYQMQSVQDEAGKPVVAPLLDSTLPGLRALAAAFLFRLGEEDKAEALAAALKTGDVPWSDFIRVQNMLTRGPRPPDGVLDALLGLVESPPSGYGLSLVVGLLGEFPYPKAAPALKKLLDHDEALVAKAAFDALSKIPGAITPEVTHALLEGKDEARRVSAAEALRRVDDLSGLPAVVDVLRHGTTSRAEAARALGGFRVRAAGEPLIDALLDPDLSVRANAQSSLTTLLQTLYPYRRLDLASTGYQTNAAPEVRAAAVGKIRAWWQANKDAGW